MLEKVFFRKAGVIWTLVLVVIALSLSVSQAETTRKVPLRIITVNSLSEAKKIIIRLKKGVSFNTLIEERTPDGAKGKGEELGSVDISTLQPLLRKAVSRMKEGDISGAIKTGKNRYVVVQIMDFTYYRKGAAAFRAGDFTAAATNLLEHIKLYPNALKARIMLAEIYEHDKYFDKAETAYREILSYDPKNWISYMRLGKLYMENGQYEKARDIYLRGFENIPDSKGLEAGLKDAEAQLSVSPSPAKTPRPLPGSVPGLAGPASPAAVKSAALPRVSAVVTKDDRSMHLRMVVVGSESEAGDILSDLKKGKPFSIIAREKTLDENSRAEYGYLGELKIQSLDKPILSAVRNLKVGHISGIIKLDEKRYAIMQAADFHYYDQAEKAFIEEDFRTAEKKLLKHLDLNQDDAKAYLMLGKIYEDRKETGKAEEMYKKGISLHPRVVLLYLRLGKLYQSQRQFQKSKDVYVEGLRNVPSSELLAQGIEMVDILLFGEGGKRQ